MKVATHQHSSLLAQWCQRDDLSVKNKMSNDAWYMPGHICVQTDKGSLNYQVQSFYNPDFV